MAGDGVTIVTTLQLRDGMVVHDLSGPGAPKGGPLSTRVVKGNPVRMVKSTDAMVRFADSPGLPDVYGVLHRWALVA